MIRAVPPVLLAGGLVIALVTAVAAQTAAPAGQAPRPTAPQAAPGQPAATAPGPSRPQQGGVAPTTTDRITVDRARPRNYARCNRAALRRALKGGERRRFITRCRLGYDIPPRPR